jgi:uncharacterized protein with PQ loop repeat
MTGVQMLATMTSCWGVAMALSPTLQIRTMLRTGSSEEVSVTYFAVLTAGFVLWGSYGAVIGEPVLVVPNIISTVFGLLTIGVALRLRGVSRRTAGPR